MKKVFLTLFVILSAVVAKSQSLVDTNKIWSEAIINEMNQITENYYFKFSGDTTIASFQYKKIMRSDDEFMTSWYHYNNYYIREDTSKKVFLNLNDGNPDKLIYDFGVNIGDTVTIEYPVIINVVVDTMYSVNILGLNRNKIVIDESGCKYELIEGIGNTTLENSQISICGLFIPATGLCPAVGGDHKEILCVKEDGNLIYQNPNYTECFYITNVTFNRLNNTVNIYPNPANTEINIELAKNNENTKIEIFNNIGQIVYSADTKNNIEKIDISKLSSGMYFVKLSNRNLSHIKKIVLK